MTNDRHVDSINDDISSDDIETAAERFRSDGRDFIRRTPLWKLPGSTFGFDLKEIWLKLEHLQVGGSFKARGMYNRLLANQPIPDSGVIVASGGNAGIATAVAAKALGVRCEVFVPESCPPAKQSALEAFDANVERKGAVYAEAAEAALARQQDTGALLVHAYNQPEVVAGAGTLAREIEQQGDGPPDSVLVSVGGGGLIAGIASWFQSSSQVIALESELTPTLFRAREAGQPIDVPVSGITKDALGATKIGSIAWAITQRYVGEALLVIDDAIRRAQLTLWKEFKLAVEPAAALGLAALQTGAYRPEPQERVCLVLCGANFDPSVLSEANRGNRIPPLVAASGKQ